MRITIYDTGGKPVREIGSGFQDAGIHQVTWDGRDRAGRRVSSGVFYYVLRAEETSAVRKMLVTK